MSAPGVAGSLMKGMYYFLHLLYTHEAGKRARGAIQLRGPRFGRRKSARLLRSRNPTGLFFYTTGVALFGGLGRCWRMEDYKLTSPSIALLCRRVSH